MGRRKPQARRPGRVPLGLPTSYRNDADAAGDGVLPFLVSGGRANFLELGEGGLFGAENGVQLCCSVYVPSGRVGWVKQLRIAPRLPAQLGQAWRGFASRFQAFPPGVIRTPGQVGVWETPMGWESYTDNLVTPSLADAPQWRWYLTMLQGTIEAARASVNPQNLPFDPFDLATCYLVPEIPVDADAYGTGLVEPAIPGASPGSPFSGQRMQVLQTDELTAHVMIPPDHTACLFASWNQTEYQPRVVDAATLTVENYGFNIYPLWPSFGQLLGYTQPTTTDTAIANAKFGWGG